MADLMAEGKMTYHGRHDMSFRGSVVKIEYLRANMRVDKQFVARNRSCNLTRTVST